MKTIFFTDLDNTIIYSHRREMPAEKQVVEYWQGREQSYMTRKTMRFLQAFSRQPGHFLVPVTTRSREQYLRITGLQALHCPYALIYNGALLLKNGVSDPQWEADSLREAGEALRELPGLYEAMRPFVPPEHLHAALPYMVFAKTEDPLPLMQTLTGLCRGKGIQVVYSATKLYCIPEAFNKGTAARRLSRRLSPDACILAAGDSEFDRPLLQEADIAFAPRSLSPQAKGKTVLFPDGFFSDALCDEMQKLLSSDA